MYNESAKKATLKYLKTQKQIRFWVRPDFYDQIQTAAAEAGYPSLRQFYIAAINDQIKKIKNGQKDPQDVYNS